MKNDKTTSDDKTLKKNKNKTKELSDKHGEQQIKTNLKERLAYIMMIYMDGLNQKKQKKLRSYLDKQLANAVNYYTGLLKKPHRKTTKVLKLNYEMASAALNEEFNKIADKGPQPEQNSSN